MDYETSSITEAPAIELAEAGWEAEAGEQDAVEYAHVDDAPGSGAGNGRLHKEPAVDAIECEPKYVEFAADGDGSTCEPEQCDQDDEGECDATDVAVPVGERPWPRSGAARGRSGARRCKVGIELCGAVWAGARERWRRAC